jgi:hypothetical protein
MHSAPAAHYDRFLIEIPCDRCTRLATYTYRYRWPGAGWQEMHTCNVHRKATEARCTTPRSDGELPKNLMRVARTAF